MQRNGLTLPPIVVRPDKQDEYLHYLGAGDGSGPGINVAPLGEILDMESIYKDTSRNIAQVIELELAEVRAAGDQSVLPPLDALAREMRFRESLIARKFGALLVAKDVAIQRFGHDQVETFFNGGRLPQVNRRGGNVSVRQAYSALFNAKLLVEGIGVLNSQSATVKGMIAVVQAQEAERIAQEQARLAAEHARQVAQEQARVAQEQARRLAEELARQAAANELRRLEEEQARLAAEALERKRAEEQAALEAEAEARRVAEEKRRQQTPGGHNSPLRFQGNISHAQLVFATSGGAVAIADSLMAGLAASIRSAVAVLSGLAAGTASGLMVGVSAFVYSPVLGNGELPERFLLSLPLADLLPGPLPDLNTLANERARLNLPVRLSTRPLTGSLAELLVVPVAGTKLPSGVRVIAAGYNAGDNTYSATLTDVPPTSAVWTPAVTPADSSTLFPTGNPAPPRYIGGNLVPIEGRIDAYPGRGNIRFDDFILVFPPETGLPPQYVMFRDRRNDPGVASGYGASVQGGWLEAATQGEGAAIPSKIADQLRGKNFKDFRAFRETFWKAVSADAELAMSFDPGSLSAMSKGRSPYVKAGDRVGKRVKFELHHVSSLSDGGQLYDIDNLRLLTPKQHLAVHKGAE
ncbi:MULTISPECIES: S-type pyocin domain-containing protein [Pseudomonas fluorescens group]|uniref:S-type pyocin domain-containing protein n=1 Tax=Pseudomonas fluorescens group TaxID=136843 RepID=UPI000879C97F|nr:MULTISPECIES: S-type pyocin domain-containing protein [Pseudomonas fluorescens group]UST60507.1 S-type pyocin domain-containing protein [Pseudomonas moraviensis]SDU51096.1 S-type Pyocin [Pseudomonas moraviensis]